MDSSLFRALASGDVDGLKQLIASNEDLLLQITTSKNTTLHIAVQFNTICIEEVCKRCPLMLLEQNLEGDTPLHVASRLGLDGVVQYLINHAQIHQDDVEKGLGRGGSTDLAERSSSTPPTTLLQQLVRVANKENDTVLHEAVRNGQFPVVQLLIEADPTFEYFANNAGETPLYLAIKDGFSHVVNWILDKCPSSAHGGPGGRTALHAAALLTQDSVIRKVLLEKKPNIFKEVDEYECSALHYAAFCGNVNMVVELLDIDVDRSVAYMLDKDGKTALHHVASNTNAINPNHVQVIEAVTQRCPDCWEMLDNNGQNFFHVATENGRLDVILYVLAMKSKMMEQFINKKDKDGNTPFHLVVKSGSGDCWRTLIANNRVNTRAIDKRMSLQLTTLRTWFQNMTKDHLLQLR
ncbi:Ankyrin repeat [Macleaya cordata]|uniref:Ankyrin repeat n=1 Tax=Macleaya cordata TaxID=56857 RepID=A0A200Q4L1_MACCD|nr:Ankyrin repeat [Macleaya cordata]